MAGLDDLFAQIPTQQIAAKLGADEAEVDEAIQTLVPVLVGGLQHNAENPENVADIESAANSHAARGLLDRGSVLDDVDEDAGQQAVATIFGGNDNTEVAAALSGGGAGNNDLIQKLLPILTPIVLAYIGKQLGGAGKDDAAESHGGGGLGEVLGNILGGGSNNPLGTILGGMLGDNKGGILGGILGGLLGGKK